jgi:hypothetical protein
MGRFLKNIELVAASSAIRLPTGTTLQRPDVPVNGQMRFNTDLQRFEVYYNGWRQMAISGYVNIVKDTFTGDGVTTSFILSLTPVSTLSILVFVGNVHQNPNDAFLLSGNHINFSTAPPLGQTIIVLHNFASTDAN